MTSDERLEKLTEQTDALTQIMELLHHDRQQNAENIRMLRRIGEVRGENIHALARIAEIHERRLTDLEGQ